MCSMRFLHESAVMGWAGGDASAAVGLSSAAAGGFLQEAKELQAGRRRGAAPQPRARTPRSPVPSPSVPLSPAGLSRRAVLVEGAGGAERRGQQFHGRRRQAAAEQLRR